MIALLKVEWIKTKRTWITLYYLLECRFSFSCSFLGWSSLQI